MFPELVEKATAFCSKPSSRPSSRQVTKDAAALHDSDDEEDEDEENEENEEEAEDEEDEDAAFHAFPVSLQVYFYFYISTKTIRCRRVHSRSKRKSWKCCVPMTITGLYWI